MYRLVIVDDEWIKFFGGETPTMADEEDQYTLVLRRLREDPSPDSTKPSGTVVVLQGIDHLWCGEWWGTLSVGKRLKLFPVEHTRQRTEYRIGSRWYS